MDHKLYKYITKYEAKGIPIIFYVVRMFHIASNVPNNIIYSAFVKRYGDFFNSTFLWFSHKKIRELVPRILQ